MKNREQELKDIIVNQALQISEKINELREAKEESEKYRNWWLDEAQKRTDLEKLKKVETK